MTTTDNCKDIQSLIPGYLARELSLNEARTFTEHLKHCSDCRDEVEISYLLKEGITRVENGESIDLHADLEEMLDSTEDTIQYLTQYRNVVYLVESTAVFVLVACFLLLFII
ncbi:MAG: zf-HC2 domain-containing protein [Lachnospiraceae bacterium]|nr:zf-HC2 domain-containing protein [Lachnospiraceae bacterium]